MRPKYDILWKGMIEEVMEDLLLFVDHAIGQELDLERGFVFLDKELAELYPEPGLPANTKLVDKLVKILLRDESERWMLLHLEVQGSSNTDFSRRMFDYYVRLSAKVCAACSGHCSTERERCGWRSGGVRGPLLVDAHQV